MFAWAQADELSRDSFRKFAAQARRSSQLYLLSLIGDEKLIFLLFSSSPSRRRERIA
uniref:Uncharacterized protein n=1 Tax=Arundo donax TaxID=35708 RepID=A0A0A8ZUT3_ARUDO